MLFIFASLGSNLVLANDGIQDETLKREMNEGKSRPGVDETGFYDDQTLINHAAIQEAIVDQKKQEKWVKGSSKPSRELDEIHRGTDRKQLSGWIGVSCVLNQRFLQRDDFRASQSLLWCVEGEAWM